MSLFCVSKHFRDLYIFVHHAVILYKSLAQRCSESLVSMPFCSSVLLSACQLAEENFVWLIEVTGRGGQDWASVTATLTAGSSL